MSTTLAAPTNAADTRPHFRTWEEYYAAKEAAEKRHTQERWDGYYAVCRINNDPACTPAQRKEAMQAWVDAGEPARKALEAEIATLQERALESGVL